MIPGPCGSRMGKRSGRRTMAIPDWSRPWAHTTQMNAHMGSQTQDRSAV